MVVKPTRSTNMTETRRRSATGGWAEPAGDCVGSVAGGEGVGAVAAREGVAQVPDCRSAPHSPQNLAPSTVAVPQFGHAAASREPQFRQNFWPGLASAPQMEQSNNLSGRAP